jgi:hypothetical protein
LANRDFGHVQPLGSTGHSLAQHRSGFRLLGSALDVMAVMAPSYIKFQWKQYSTIISKEIDSIANAPFDQHAPWMTDNFGSQFGDEGFNIRFGFQVALGRVIGSTDHLGGFGDWAGTLGWPV